jgi:predicted ATPase/signal transduction histidine kinase
MSTIINGYSIGEKLYESPRSIIYRARRNLDGARVIVKTMNKEHPTPGEIANFMREYEITKSLALDGVITIHGLERYRSRLCLLLEDFGARSLRETMASIQLTLESSLQIALEVAEVLGAIHARNVIHKDINPSNIVINLTTNQIKIIDFGLATALSRENPVVRSPNLIEGTLTYISPEQTGRMNRAIDYRTDLYSLGATLYEMLTGAPPFQADNAMELIHYHIARQPIPPHALRPEIPVVLSEIVQKLLSKTAEERYRSAYGLKMDLQECLNRLRSSGRIESFSIGARDLSDRFQVPQKLYGREAEIKILLETFDRASQGVAELMLVTGYSGIGKGTLVNEIHKPILAKRGYFISGKFDQLQRDVPYSSMIQAFQDLVRQLLTESEELLAAWRARLLDALGMNGSVITDVIPEVALIIGEQPPAPALAPTETQNRFRLVFQSFVNVFAAHDRPLVIFLDDLQWADIPSLSMIQLLTTDTVTRNVLLIGAYRDNEMTGTHPLSLMLDTAKRAGAKVTEIYVGPLRFPEVTELVDDMFQCGLERAAPLSALLIEKTHGNPFFLAQFLKSLYEDGLVAFDGRNGEWKWDLDEIRARAITDNVVELTTRKLRKLSVFAQRVMELASCVGNHVDLWTLSLAYEGPRAELAAGLWEALAEGLLLPGNKAHHFSDKASLARVFFEGGAELEPAADVNFLFQHDRVQQAAYGLLTDGERREVHLKLGRLIFRNAPEGVREDRLFDIVHHLNMAVDLITSPEDRLEAARLNLHAGRRAIASSAHEPGLRLFNMGLRLLEGTSRDEHHDIHFALHVEAMQAEYLNAHTDRAHELAETALRFSKTVLEKVQIYEIQMRSHVAMGEMSAGCRVGLLALELLGARLPSPEMMQPMDMVEAMQKAQLAVMGKRAEDLLKLPELTDPHKLAALRIMFLFASPAIVLNPQFILVIACESIAFCVEHGLSPLAPGAIVDYAMVLATAMNDFVTANEYGAVAEELIERYSNPQLKPKVLLFNNSFIRIWKTRWRDTVEPLREAFTVGMEVGSLADVGFSAQSYTAAVFVVGSPLDFFLVEQAKYFDTLQRLSQPHPARGMLPWRYWALAMTGQTTAQHPADAIAMNGDAVLAECLAVNDTISLAQIYYIRAIVHYAFGRYAEAVVEAEKGQDFLPSVPLSTCTVIFNMAHSLALLALYDTADESRKKRCLQQAKNNQSQMQTWAGQCPENIEHKLKLVEAEIARVTDRPLEAMESYDQAIQGAARYGFLHEEALANERCGEFYLALGRTRVAAAYLNEARYAYLRWGAAAKVSDIERRHGSLLESATAQMTARSAHPLSLSTSSSYDGSGGEALDLMSVMKAARAISGEIVLDRLVEMLTRILLENAGGQRGILLLEKDGRLVVEAEAVVEGSGVTTRCLSSEVEPTRMSASIIQYIGRTRESVVLGDATAEGLFTKDPYIVSTGLKSVLGAPLINQGKLVAIIYLENKLTANAFTEDRLEVLRLLSAQAALSIHNASLYAQLTDYGRTLEQKVEERTRQLREAQERIVKMEKEATEVAMAGGFAHEVRNALASAEIYLTMIADLADQRFSDQLASVSAQLVRGEAAGATDEGTPADQLAALADRLAGVENTFGVVFNGITTGVDRALTITKVILDYSNIGKQAPGKLPIAVRPIVEAVLGELEQSLSDHVISVDVAIAKEEQLTMSTRHIHAIVKNLVQNACDAVIERLLQERAEGQAAGGGTIRIAVAVEPCRTVLEVKDNGVGIQPRDRSKLFEPFFSTKPATGAGLGLNFVQKLVSIYNGSIEVDSELGRGTSFRIVFPSAQAAAPRE